uniref:Uncharacterized protein n=1 Tax=Quercus lobata TaxID=97700 RepID=A0A7N2LDY1_QUELO
MMCAHVFRYEFKTNHEEWVNLVKPKLGPDVSDRVLAAINTTHENIKILYKVRIVMWAALQNLLKEIGSLTFDKDDQLAKEFVIAAANTRMSSFLNLFA